MRESLVFKPSGNEIAHGAFLPKAFRAGFVHNGKSITVHDLAGRIIGTVCTSVLQTMQRLA